MTATSPSESFTSNSPSRTMYSRIGYAPQTTEPFESMYPELVPELATECDFTLRKSSGEQLERQRSGKDADPGHRLAWQPSTNDLSSKTRTGLLFLS
jgi:hypothetical protein